MRRLLMAAGAALTLLLGGCATTIRSNVTTFHQWPAELQDKTYVFEAPPVQDDTLELRSYQNLVRGQLARLGFQDAGESGKPTLKISMKFTTTDVPVRVVEVVDPFFIPHPRFAFGGYGYGYRGRYWGARRYWGGWHSPFYDPFWSGAPMYRERIDHQYRRELQVAIKTIPGGKRLFDVTVHNMSREMSTPALMPALVQSAFAEFPGVSGVARRVELKRER
ncbi:DUF4136 domain-containing protein [Massilia scottii]|uniref:DUF4136 domain-containing protein n=1 Tax=Massilia scottii TaxID=3057166 RepID=UPI002796E25C|nr:DUF4136 domain-containing protein [Massilia sp. CCM 9029]MDQ1829491.1 DUF4136 domain-containing protein [Massilia sp. CCM 9029]